MIKFIAVNGRQRAETEDTTSSKDSRLIYYEDIGSNVSQNGIFINFRMASFFISQQMEFFVIFHFDVFSKLVVDVIKLFMIEI